jgi:hypothetical protein
MEGYVVTENGEKFLPGSRRPDGTIRKERRIRAGYVPQDEQPVYQSVGVMVSRQRRCWLGCSAGWGVVCADTPPAAADATAIVCCVLCAARMAHLRHHRQLSRTLSPVHLFKCRFVVTFQSAQAWILRVSN